MAVPWCRPTNGAEEGNMVSDVLTEREWLFPIGRAIGEIYRPIWWEGYGDPGGDLRKPLVLEADESAMFKWMAERAFALYRKFHEQELLEIERLRRGRGRVRGLLGPMMPARLVLLNQELHSEVAELRVLTSVDALSIDGGFSTSQLVVAACDHKIKAMRERQEALIKIYRSLGIPLEGL